MKKLLILFVCLFLISCATGTVTVPQSHLTQSQMEELRDYCYGISKDAKQYADCMITQEIPKPKAKILDTNHRRDSIGNFIVIGQIKNTGLVRIRFLKISCTAHDSKGKLIDVDTTYSEPSDVDPGDDATFTCYLEETKPISTYECKPVID